MRAFVPHFIFGVKQVTLKVYSSLWHLSFFSLSLFFFRANFIWVILYFPKREKKSAILVKKEKKKSGTLIE
jgi:hypothetical protein